MTNEELNKIYDVIEILDSSLYRYIVKGSDDDYLEYEEFSNKYIDEALSIIKKELNNEKD